MPFNVGSVSVDVVPDATGFQAKLDALVRGVKAKVELDLDAAGFQQKVEAATKGATAKVKLKVDSSETKAAIREATKDTTAKVKLAADAKEAKATITEATKDQKVKVKVEAEAKAAQADIAAVTKSQTVMIRLDVEERSAEQVKADIRRRMAQEKADAAAASAPTPSQQARTFVSGAQQGTTVQVVADTKPAEAQVAALKKSIGSQKAVISVKANGIEKAKAEYQRLVQEISAKRIQLDLDGTAIRVELARLAQEIARVQGEIKLSPKDDALKAELSRLKSERVDIRVDFDAHAAGVRAEIADLNKRRVNLKVDIDGAPKAEAELDTVARDRKSKVKVDVDSKGAKNGLLDVEGSASATAGVISALIAVGAGIGPAIVPVAAAAAAAIGSIGPAALLSVGGIGVLVGGLRNVVGAVSSSIKAQDAASVAAAKSATSQVNYASQIASAQSSLKGAEDSLANARANAASGATRAAQAVVAAQQGVRQATQQAAAGVQQAIANEATAERSLNNALAQEKDAQAALSAARQQAKRDIEDLTNSLADGQLNQRQAALDVQQTYDALVASQDSGSRLEREAAQLAYDKAVQAQKEAAQNQGRLVDEQKKSKKNGVEGDPNVVSARKNLADAKAAIVEARRAAVEAQKAITQARVDGANSVAKAEQDLANAQQAQTEQRRSAAFSIAQAQRSVADAQRSLTDAQNKTAKSSSAASTALTQSQLAMDKLTPSGRALARFLIGTVVPGFRALQQVAEVPIANGLLSGLKAASPIMGPLTLLVQNLAVGMGDLFRAAGRALGSPFWTQFTTFLAGAAEPTIHGFGVVIGNVVTGLAGLFQAMQPISNAIGQWFVNLTAQFKAFGNGGKDNALGKFIDYVTTTGPEVAQTFGSIIEAVGHLMEALAPLGGRVLAYIDKFSQYIANLPVEQLTKVTTAFLALIAGVAGTNVLVASVTGITTALGFLTKGVGRVVGISGALGLALLLLYKQSQPFRDLVNSSLLPALKDLATWVETRLWPALKRMGDTITNDLMVALEGVKAAIDRNRPAWDQLLGAITGIANFAVDVLVPALGTAVGGAFEALSGLIGIAVSALGAFTGLLPATQGVVLGIGAIFLALKGLKILAPVSAGLKALGAQAVITGTQMQVMGNLAAGSQVEVGVMGNALANARTAAGGIVSGFGKVASFLGGPWGLAVGGAVLGIGFLVSKHYEAKRASKEFADQLTYENGALDENSRQTTANALSKDGTLATVAKLGISTQDYTKALLDGGPARQAMIHELEAIAEQHQTGVDEFGRPMFDQTGEDALRASGQLDTLGGSIETNAKAAKEADTALGGAADKTGQLGSNASTATPLVDGLTTATQSLRDAQANLRTAVDNVINSFTVLNGGSIDLERANEAFAAATDKAAAKTRFQGKSLAENTAAGAANRGVIVDMVNALNDQATATFKNTYEHSKARTEQGKLNEAAKAANGVLAKGKGVIDDVAHAAHLNTGKVHEMVAQMTKTPAQIKTEVQIPGGQEAEDQVKRIKYWTDLLKSKKVDIKFSTNAADISKAVGYKINVNSPNSPGSGTIRRDGGPIALPKRATGGPIRGVGGPRQDNILGFDRNTGLQTAWVSNHEFVVNAAAYKRNKALVEAINAGADLPRFRNGGQIRGPINNGPLNTGAGHYQKIEYNFQGPGAGVADLPGILDKVVGNAMNAFAKGLGAATAKKFNTAAAADDGSVGPTGNGRFRPVKGGSITQGLHDQWTGFPAIDFGVPVGTRVMAAASGRVSKSHDIHGGGNGGYASYGRVIQILSKGFETLYAHLSRRDVKVGQSVLGGQVIGLSGNTGNSTGPHLHFGAKGISPLKFLKNTGTSGGGSTAGISGSNQARGHALMLRHGWGENQWASLKKLWTRESGWRTTALNRSSGAYGIPQALPASKMRSAGSDWRTNPNTQIQWGLDYIKSRYGSPNKAWGWETRHGWYDNGGWLQPGTTVVHNDTGKPEPVLNPAQWKLLESLANGGGRNNGPMVHVERIETADARGVARELESKWALRDALYPSWH